MEQSLTKILNQPKTLLADIINKTKQLNFLNQKLKEFLEAKLSEHCRVANLREKTLVIEIDSGLWATKLRFQIPELLKHFKSVMGLESIEWYIQPPESIQRITPKKLSLSSDTIELLKQTAHNIESTSIKDSLLNLTQRDDE